MKKRETTYKLRKRLKKIQDELESTRKDLYLYRAVTHRLYSWLTPFAKRGETASPNASWGLDQMKELFK